MKLAYSLLASIELDIATRVLSGLPMIRMTMPNENNDQASSLLRTSSCMSASMKLVLFIVFDELRTLCNVI